MLLDLSRIRLPFRDVKREIVCDSSTRLGLGEARGPKSHLVKQSRAEDDV